MVGIRAQMIPSCTMGRAALIWPPAATSLTYGYMLEYNAYYEGHRNILTLFVIARFARNHMQAGSMHIFSSSVSSVEIPTFLLFGDSEVSAFFQNRQTQPLC